MEWDTKGGEDEPGRGIQGAQRAEKGTDGNGECRRRFRWAKQAVAALGPELEGGRGGKRARARDPGCAEGQTQRRRQGEI